MTSFVELSSLVKVFPGGVRALDGLDFTIEEGEFFALLGPSGCGKTTLLRTIAGLESPTSGQISIDGRDVTGVPAGKRNVAMVFQDYALYPHMTVVDNIGYPLKVRKVAKPERRETAAEAASHLQLGELLERRPGQLSGGQQQRVALARAIAYHPTLFLFDEPLSNLDARLRLEARTFLKRLQRELGVTTIYVTHDQSEALALADRVAVMEAGRIRQLATPAEIYNRPASLFVASFIGSTPMNLLPGTVEGDRIAIGGVSFPIPGSASEHVSDAEEVILGIRPEHARIGQGEEPGFDGKVIVVELLGIDHLVTVELGSVTVQATSRQAPEIGEQVKVMPEIESGLVYRAEDGGLAGTSMVEGPTQLTDLAAGQEPIEIEHQG